MTQLTDLEAIIEISYSKSTPHELNRHSEKPRSIIPSPPENTESGASDIHTQFTKAIGGILGRRSNAKVAADDQTRVIAEKAGYDFSSKLGLVVRQRYIDVAVDRNLRKRYKVRIRAMG